MNVFTKSLLATLVLGAASTAIYAVEDDAGSADRGGRPPSGCGETCTGQIPIELKVEKHCDLDVLTSKISLADGGSGSGSFKVGANAPYNMEVSTQNGSKVKMGTNEIPITITTKLSGSATNIPLNTPQSNIAVALGGWNTYNVNVTSAAVGISKPAGTYSELYKIRVYF